MKENILKQLQKDNIDFYAKLVIAFGLLRTRDECAICGKRIKINNYHIQMCKNCRKEYLERFEE